MLHDFLVLDILSINNKSIPLWLLVTISSESQHFYLEELIWQSPLVDNTVRVSNKYPSPGEQAVVIVFTF